MTLSNVLRGIGGEFEIGRALLAGSGIAAIVTPIVFQALDMAHNGWHFDVTAWCVAYPGGLTALASLGVYAIGKKDKDVAAAKATTASTNQTNADAESTRADTARREES
jgi:hypothetical protein